MKKDYCEKIPFTEFEEIVILLLANCVRYSPSVERREIVAAIMVLCFCCEENSFLSFVDELDFWEFDNYELIDLGNRETSTSLECLVSDFIKKIKSFNIPISRLELLAFMIDIIRLLDFKFKYSRSKEVEFNVI